MNIVSVVDGVREYIRNGIITGELGAGQKLNEDQLAAKFGISRPPLREAFKILESELLLNSIPRKGCYVASLSLEDFEQISDARLMIECSAMDIIKKKNFRDVSKIFLAYDRVSHLDLSHWASISTGERLEYFKALAEYHVKLVEFSGNNLLIHFYRTLNYNLSRYQYIFDMKPDSPASFEVSQKDHRLILECIERGEYDQAKDYLRSHISNFVVQAREKIKEQ